MGEKNIGFEEDLHIEFKSDIKRLDDSDMVDVIVAFANTDGGALYLGVEDNGVVTGLHETHKDITRLGAFIANKTVPSISVRCQIVKGDNWYLKIDVPRSKSVVASSNGKLLKRRIKANGEPENVPMYPYEIEGRLSALSLLDYSAQGIPESNLQDFDDMQREKIRNAINLYNGNKSLLELTNEEFDKALRFVANVDGRFIPTLTGILLIGKKDKKIK